MNFHRAAKHVISSFISCSLTVSLQSPACQACWWRVPPLHDDHLEEGHCHHGHYGRRQSMEGNAALVLRTVEGPIVSCGLRPSIGGQLWGDGDGPWNARGLQQICFKGNSVAWHLAFAVCTTKTVTCQITGASIYVSGC